MPAWTLLATTRIGGLDIVTASRRELAETLLADRRLVRDDHRGARLVFDANGQALSLAARDPAYADALTAADVIHADGGFLVTLSRWIGTARIAERSATTDMIHDLAAACAATGLSFYLFGSSEAVNARCAERLVELYPGLRIAGRHHGYFAEDELDAIVADINAVKPDVVWIALGKPREQLLATRIGPKLFAAWLVSCGGCFDFVVGKSTRAPLWMQRTNLEWLHRLCQDPKRLFWRYASTNPHALWVVLRHAARGELLTARDLPQR
jgi:N-acetylglucosaminyldiphosphoundecaprenol N-acetyl-beta-D-mannosaminyltransferase